MLHFDESTMMISNFISDLLGKRDVTKWPRLLPSFFCVKTQSLSNVIMPHLPLCLAVRLQVIEDASKYWACSKSRLLCFYKPLLPSAAFSLWLMVNSHSLSQAV